MCIRDRASDCSRCGNTRSFSPVKLGGTMASMRCGPGAVSYTHLRAHETPEHLVCRLLLEKKKDAAHRSICVRGNFGSRLSSGKVIDRNTRRRVAIIGMGILSPIGNSKEEVTKALTEGRS